MFVVVLYQIKPWLYKIHRKRVRYAEIFPVTNFAYNRWNIGSPALCIHSGMCISSSFMGTNSLSLDLLTLSAFNLIAVCLFVFLNS